MKDITRTKPSSKSLEGIIMMFTFFLVTPIIIKVLHAENFYILISLGLNISMINDYVRSDLSNLRIGILIGKYSLISSHYKF